jgi:glutamate dehydrogenase
VRRDPFERFVSCLIYVPRERFNTALRLRFQEILEEAYEGKVTAYTTHMTDEVLGRVHMVVQTRPGAIPTVPTAEVETRLVEAGRSWSDDLQEALISSLGEERGIDRYRRYAEAFPLGYRERFPAGFAVYDIARIEETLERRRMAINLYRPVEAPSEEVRLKIYNAGGQVALSDILPMLEHMGLKVISEVPYEVQPVGRGTVWVHDFSMQSPDGSEIDVSRVREAFEEALIRVWLGEMEDDGFNKLILRASLSWRAGGGGTDLESEEIGDRVGDEEADGRRFHRDPQAALEHAQPCALEEVAIGRQRESGPDQKPRPLPEAHPHHQPERRQQEQHHHRDRQAEIGPAEQCPSQRATRP